MKRTKCLVTCVLRDSRSYFASCLQSAIKCWGIKVQQSCQCSSTSPKLHRRTKSEPHTWFFYHSLKNMGLGHPYWWVLCRPWIWTYFHLLVEHQGERLIRLLLKNDNTPNWRSTKNPPVRVTLSIFVAITDKPNMGSWSGSSPEPIGFAALNT